VRRLYTIDQFARLEDQERDAELGIAISSVDSPELGENGRLVRYVFSTPAVGRDLHTVAARAWQLENFVRNPVFLWAHDDTLPPIGRVTEIGDENGKLTGWVEYAERELNPFADTIYQLVRARYINAVSTSWQPLEWSFSRDKSRPGGVDFTKVDLLEISQVPIPAHPAALAEARSHGIDTGPLFSWAERLLDEGGMILVPRNELETLRRAAKMPAAAKRVAKATSQTHATQAEGSEITRALRAKHTRALEQAPKVPKFQRGMYGVAQLAYLLDQLGYCHSASEYEAAVEEDGSDVPAMLGEALVKCGEALVAMTQEEVAELLAVVQSDAENAEAEIRSLSMEDREHVAAASNPKARAWRIGLVLARAGRAISTANEKQLREASAHHERAMKHHDAMGEHHEAVGEHLDEAQTHHERATSAVEEVGEHIRAAQDKPGEATAHLERAAKCQRAAEKHLGGVAEAHRNLDDRNEDVGDGHRAMGRSMKAAHRCMRAVLDNGDESTEPEDEATGAGDADAAKEKERRSRRARALQLAQEPIAKI
jgi:HK97 family phage prohead protease